MVCLGGDFEVEIVFYVRVVASWRVRYWLWSIRFKLELRLARKNKRSGPARICQDDLRPRGRYHGLCCIVESCDLNMIHRYVHTDGMMDDVDESLIVYFLFFIQCSYFLFFLILHLIAYFLLLIPYLLFFTLYYLLLCLLCPSVLP